MAKSNEVRAADTEKEKVIKQFEDKAQTPMAVARTRGFKETCTCFIDALAHSMASGLLKSGLP